jgi:hypothetical protein
MSKLIRSKTAVYRPKAQGGKRPIYVIASGGEVYRLKRLAGAAVWVAANEADFTAKPAEAANEPFFNA